MKVRLKRGLWVENSQSKENPTKRNGHPGGKKKKQGKAPEGTSIRNNQRSRLFDGAAKKKAGLSAKKAKGKPGPSGNPPTGTRGISH